MAEVVEKPLSVSLFAFNNKIVSMKPTIKKCKMLVIRKLNRQVVVLKAKKGNEKQIAKNQRKAQKLKDEMVAIKNLKFNDIAIYCMENELTLNQLLKSKQKMDLNERSLAKISLHKLIVTQIEKLKKEEKDWRKILIQYKARIEKKRSWKEKQKFHKEIEESLAKMQEQDSAVENKDENQEERLPPAKEAVGERKNGEEGGENKKQKDVKSEKQMEANDDVNSNHDESENDDEVALNDDGDSDDDANSVNSFDSNAYDNVANESSDEEHEEEEEEEEEDEAPPPPVKVKKQIPKIFIEDIKTNYKPRVNTTSKEMVIKQLALDELSDFDEIPIENDENSTSKEEPVLRNKSQPATYDDPFFISANGNVAQKIDTSRARVDDSIKDNFEEEFDDRRFKSFKQMNSTFTSLSSSSSYGDSNNRNRFDRRDNYNTSYDSRPKRSYNDRDGDADYNNGYRKPNNGFSNRDRLERRFDSEKTGPRKFDSDETPRFQRNFNETREKPKPVEDLSNLHPSWKAKKEQEEKLKSLKFTGTKVKFDD